MAASRGSESSRISSRASTSRCQGLTPKEPQPARATEASIAKPRLKRPIMVSSSLMFRQQLAHLRFVHRAVDRSKPHMSKAWRAMAVDQHARGHAMHLVKLRELSVRVEVNVECRMELFQEFIRTLGVGFEIDGKYLEPLRFVGALQGLHPRKRLFARPAPRCPKVQVHDATTGVRQVKRRGGVSGIEHSQANAHENESHPHGHPVPCPPNHLLRYLLLT